jgi:hypothetical protein
MVTQADILDRQLKLKGLHLHYRDDPTVFIHAVTAFL